MMQDFTMKSQALKITLQLLDDDDRRLALEAAPQKFLKAMTHRAMNGHGHAPSSARKPQAERKDEMRAYSQNIPGRVPMPSPMRCTGSRTSS